MSLNKRQMPQQQVQAQPYFQDHLLRALIFQKIFDQAELLDLLDAGEAAILANARKITFLTGGVTPSDAPASCTITGFRYGVATSEVLAISQVAGNVSSVNTYTEITSIVFLVGQGVAATVAAGYSSAFATAAEIVESLNEEAIAAPIDVVFSIAESASGQFLAVTSTAAGARNAARPARSPRPRREAGVMRGA